MNTNDSLRIEAPMIVIAPDQIMAAGQLVLRHGKIVDAVSHGGGQTLPPADLILHDCAIVPGLINCHTHLEFSDLRSPLPPGATFPDWIGRVVRHRREQAAGMSPAGLANHRAAIIRQGLVEAASSGTALLADIVTPPWSPPSRAKLRPDTQAASRLRGQIEIPGGTPESVAKLADEHLICNPQLIAFPEIIGLAADRLADSLTWAQAQLELPTTDVLCDLGLSPHAPYSLLLDLLSGDLQQVPPAVPLAMHIAESRDELQWLEHGTGAFADAFARLGIPPPPSRPSIDACLHFLAGHQRSLVVHGNYLTDPQLEFISAAKGKDTGGMSIVYCPRTHQFFGHEPYPLQQMFERGLRVPLGTDSRASNPDLNLWEEVRSARSQHSWLSPETALSMATTQAAAALGLTGQLGSLRAGSRGYLCATQLAASDTPRTLLERITTAGESPALSNVMELLG